MSCNLCNQLLTSENHWKQIFGAVLKRWCLPLLALLCLLPLFPSICRELSYYSSLPLTYLIDEWEDCFLLLGSCFLLATVISACSALTDILTLRKDEKRITNCQIAILIAIGLWILGAIYILGLQKEQKSLLEWGVIGGVLTWIFQDKVKGAVAFIHFRRHNLLNIDDWIRIPKLNVDGKIIKVTLTTVTLYNWDTTTSTIPTSVLQSEHFINLQNMSEGKTYGRRMLQAFTIDTSWIHPVDEEEMAILKSGRDKILNNLPAEDMKVGDLNINLYRLYLHHWLMDNPHVSQQPRLIVRWIEQKDSGMVLQVYAFLIASELSEFEWEQSQIIEHIVESMAWFGLRLYQSPSAYDASNSNVFMTDKPATYKMQSL